MANGMRPKCGQESPIPAVFWLVPELNTAKTAPIGCVGREHLVVRRQPGRDRRALADHTLAKSVAHWQCKGAYQVRFPRRTSDAARPARGCQLLLDGERHPARGLTRSRSVEACSVPPRGRPGCQPGSFRPHHARGRNRGSMVARPGRHPLDDQAGVSTSNQIGRVIPPRAPFGCGVGGARLARSWPPMARPSSTWMNDRRSARTPATRVCGTAAGRRLPRYGSWLIRAAGLIRIAVDPACVCGTVLYSLGGSAVAPKVP